MVRGVEGSGGAPVLSGSRYVHENLPRGFWS